MAIITRESVGNLQEKIQIKVGKTDYLPAFDKALKEYSKKASIPGFRPGKVPAGMIKKMYGPSLFMDEVLRTVDKELIQYLEQEKIEIFAQPVPADNDLTKIDPNNPQDYNFDFEIGLKPSFDLPDLATLPITQYQVQVTDDMVHAEVDRLQNRYGNVIDKELSDNEDNILNVMFTEVDANGDEVENGIKKDNSILLKYFAEAKRQDLLGKKAGDVVVMTLGEAFDEKELELIASDLGLNKDDEATKSRKFKIEITKVGQLEKRELNEDFFNQLYPGAEVKTEEAFKEKVKEEITAYWAAQSRNQIQDQIFHALSDNTKIEFPEDFLKKWLVLQNRQEQEGKATKTEAQIDAEMPSFLNQLKWTLVSDKIVKENSLVVDANELRDFAKQQLVQYMGGNGMDMLDQPWVNDYVEKMMKDQKYMEDAYSRIQAEKVLGWAETQVKPVVQEMSAEDFSKMVSEHQHHHHH